MYCSASRSGRFTLRKEPDTHFTGGWVGPTAGLEVLEEKNPRAPAGTRTVDHPTVV